MKYKVFTVFDSKVGAYLRPFFMRTHGEALRGFIDVVSDQNTDFHRHPEDYTLFEIASYDESTGKFENLITPHSHGTALEFHPNNRQLNIVKEGDVVR